MSVRAVVGAQWGDEGKGKIVDLLSGEADLVVRYQGGPNAGHTVVVNGETIILHLVPSGILQPGAQCVIGNGVVVSLPKLFEELDGLQARGISWSDRVWVSERAHLILPAHLALEEQEEKGPGAVGTTLRGIGPTYRDKMARIGITVGEFLEPERFLMALTRQQAWRQRSAPALLPETIDPELVETKLGSCRERLAPLVRDTGLLVYRAAREGKRVLLEGAQGTMLDVDHGTYPFVTSSHATVGGAATGSGLPPRYIDEVVGVTKAYTTRVGLGPFPTELTGPEGDALRDQGVEFGATTGRPRRCGWLDALALRHATRVNGLDTLAVTKLDVLAGLETLRIATSYRVGEEMVTEFPGRLDRLERAEPVYEEHPGWNEDLTGARSLDDLPETARRYLHRIEEITDVPVSLVSVGQSREQTIRVNR
jgi:adenylosuccinate synthase